MKAVTGRGFTPAKTSARRKGVLMVKMLWKFYAKSDNRPQPETPRFLPHSNRHESKNPTRRKIIAPKFRIIPTVLLFKINQNSLLLTSLSLLVLRISKIIGTETQPGSAQSYLQAISNPTS
jgi:hypothetical protein